MERRMSSLPRHSVPGVHFLTYGPSKPKSQQAVGQSCHAICAQKRASVSNTESHLLQRHPNERAPHLPMRHSQLYLVGAMQACADILHKGLTGLSPLLGFSNRVKTFPPLTRLSPLPHPPLTRLSLVSHWKVTGKKVTGKK